MRYRDFFMRGTLRNKAMAPRGFADGVASIYQPYNGISSARPTRLLICALSLEDPRPISMQFTLQLDSTNQNLWKTPRWLQEQNQHEAIRKQRSI